MNLEAMAPRSPEDSASDTRLNIPTRKRITLRSMTEPSSSIGTIPLTTIMKEVMAIIDHTGIPGFLALRISAEIRNNRTARATAWSNEPLGT